MGDFTNDYQFFVERLDKITDVQAALEKLIHQEKYLVNIVDERFTACRTALTELRNGIRKDLSTMSVMHHAQKANDTTCADPMDDGFVISLLDHPLVKSGRIKVTISNTSVEDF